MNKPLICICAALVLAPDAYAQDEVVSESSENDAKVIETEASSTETDLLVAAETSAEGRSGPKTMSGMSILGNEETPKSLVIVPWKSSEMGDELSLSDTLDERATPVDKEVFLREVNFYQIRSSEQ